MPRSGTGRGTDGLTLIELVVVVAILGLLALPAMLRFGGGGLFGGQPPAARVAAALTADLAHLRDRALLGRQRLELAPHDHGWSGGVVAQDAGFRRLRLVWQIDGPTRPDEPAAIRFLPDGRATPFSLRIEADGQPPLACRFEGWEGLSCTGP